MRDTVNLELGELKFSSIALDITEMFNGEDAFVFLIVLFEFLLPHLVVLQ